METQAINDAFLEARELWRARYREQSGRASAKELSNITDRSMVDLWNACGQAEAQLVAVGGYGRDELAYHSDVDLVLHVQDPTNPDLRVKVERFVKDAREVRLKVALAVRDEAQFRQQLGEDMRTAIAYLDARSLDGKEVAHLRQQATAFLAREDAGLGFVHDLLGGYRTRRDRYGKTIYRLEPDLKSGLGGLRDCQSLRWAAIVRFGFDPLSELAPVEGWNTTDRAELRSGLDWLLGMRNRLHFRHDRRHDRMNFDDQEALAADILPELDQAAAVETLMREHYSVGKQTWKLTERSLRRWSQRVIPFKPIGSRFRIDDTQISVERVSDPLSPDETFEALCLASERRVLLDPALERAIEASVKRWDDDVLASPGVGVGLAECLTRVDMWDRTSTRLLDMRILPKIIPEFAPIVCHVQHDVYHVYTTDVHSVRCLEAGRSLLNDGQDSCGRLWPWLKDVTDEIEDKSVFLLACLFHDIGKNRGGGHSKKGAAMMPDIGLRLGLNPAQIDVLSFLVLEHLTLSQTARRRDISDEALIADIAQTVQTRERLNLLVTLTFCDAFTVGDGVMTDWTASLLHELYLRVLRVIEGRGRSGDVRKRAHAILGGSDESLAFVDAMPARLLRDLEADVLSRYFKAYAVARLTEVPVIEFTPDPATKSSEVIVASQDQPGLLASIAGGLAANGLDILAAQIMSTNDGWTFDIFRVSRAGTPLEDPTRIERTVAALQSVLTGKLSAADLLEAKLAERRLPPKARPAVLTEVKVIPHEGDHTILEIHGPDRPGLLFGIAQTLQQHGVNIHLSFVDSEGDRVIDTFYVEEVGGGGLSAERVEAVSKALIKVVSDD